MIRILKWIVSYCPHPPKKRSLNLLPLYYKNLLLSFQIKDFRSSLDGLIGFAILYGLLFAISFLELPIVGLMGHYQFILLRVCFVLVLSFVFVYLYARLRGIRFLKLGVSGAKSSIIEAFFTLLVWAALWLMIGETTKTYSLIFDMERFAATPLAFIIGFIGSLITYGYSAPKFVEGLEEKPGIIFSSIVGFLLLFAVSMDFAIYFLPVVILLVYINVKTDSALGPIMATTLLFGVFYTYFATPNWIVPTRQFIYWFMTLVSIISAVFSGIILIRFIHPRIIGGDKL